MNLGIDVIGLICALVVALPFIITSMNRKKKEKIALMGLKTIAASQNHKITKDEYCGNFAIGLDENDNFLFHQSLDNKNLQAIDLSKIKKCELANTSRTNGTGDKVTEHLNLNLFPKDKTESIVSLEFYDKQKNMDLSGELQSIEAWNELINAKINMAS